MDKQVTFFFNFCNYKLIQIMAETEADVRIKALSVTFELIKEA